MDEPIIVQPSKTKASVIWMHGLGADGYDFEPLVEDMDLVEQGIRFILPHAPKRPVTLNGGMVMRAWFDISSISFEAEEDAVGFEQSRRLIDDLVEKEIAGGVPAQKIVLAGFSQGGALALYCALRQSHRLAGVMALSCYLPFHRKFPESLNTANQGMPIFMAHGKYDPVVPFELAVASRDLLQQYFQLEWHNYQMQHQVCLEEIHHIEAWLERLLLN